MQIVDAWLRDLPQQFQDKHNIEVLISAFARQLQEVKQMFEDLNIKTDLETATGQNLDYIGDILSLSRKDAHVIIRKAKDAEITDEVYRSILKYRAIQNSCECTYDDIIGSIQLIWDTENISYVENPERPATICITMPDVSIDAIDPAIGRVLAIKPAGVAMIYEIGYFFNINISGLEKVELVDIVAKVEIRIKENPYVSVSILVVASIMEEIEAEVVLKKNLWYLDGEYCLDGTNVLNAEETEEVL